MPKKLLIVSIIVIVCLAAVTALVFYKVLAPWPELTEDQALAIALEHAELAQGQTDFSNVHLDRDDGMWIYEIEFREGRTEYDYTVRASDGKIVDYDKDWNG